MKHSHDLAQDDRRQEMCGLPYQVPMSTDKVCLERKIEHVPFAVCGMCGLELDIDKDFDGTISAYCIAGHRYYIPYGCKSLADFRNHIENIAKVRKMLMNNEDLPCNYDQEDESMNNINSTPVYDAIRVEWNKKNKEVGARMRTARLKLGLLQRDVAALVGISAESITQYELGIQSSRDVNKMQKLADVLNLTIDDMWPLQRQKSSLVKVSHPRSAYVINRNK